MEVRDEHAGFTSARRMSAPPASVLRKGRLHRRGARSHRHRQSVESAAMTCPFIATLNEVELQTVRSNGLQKRRL
jgi:hypothetical protein